MKSLSNADFIFVNYPKTLIDFFGLKGGQQALYYVFNVRFILLPQPENNNAATIFWRVASNIGEVHIQSDQNSIFSSTNTKKRPIFFARQVLFKNGTCIVTGRTGNVDKINGKILVKFQFHAAILSGRRITRSLANSAA